MPSGRRNCFVDTNLLVYAADPDEPAKRQLAVDWLRRTIATRTLVLSPQSLTECYRVLTGPRRGISREGARRYVQALAAFCTAPLGVAVLHKAWKVQDSGEFGWWDCVLLGSALLADCELFLSEDMQHERTIDGMTILNPFKLGPPGEHLP